MPWLQLHILADRQQVETIEDAMLDEGALSVTLEDNADQPILEPALNETPLWDSTRVTGLFNADCETAEISERLRRRLGNSAASQRWEQLEDKDWEREWIHNYQPIRCGERLWICPSWREPPEPSAVNLLLDPGLAFGTGTHPTTFLCLQWLDGQRLSGKSIIDYGCGSGILAIAGLVLGADSAVAIDIDPQALIATADNAKRNGIPLARIKTSLPPDAPGNPADIVVANILAGPLAELAPKLATLTKSGGKLCLSGIIDNQAAVVMQAYRAWFDFEPVTGKDEWVRLVATKR